MAINLREMSLPLQALVFAVLAIILIAAGLYTPFSPVKVKDAELQTLIAKKNQLIPEKANLEVYQSQQALVERDIAARQSEIDHLRNIIPADKDADQFILLLQASAASAGVNIRRLKSLPVVARDQYYELPFEVDVDGPFYAVSGFFSRLRNVSRIVNVGDLNFKSTAEGAGRKYPLRPGTTVSGTFVAITFFSKVAEEPAKQPAAPPAKH